MRGGAFALLWIPLLAPSPLLAVEDAPSALEQRVGPWLRSEHHWIHLNVRTRLEIADFKGLDRSEAVTTRTRLGLGLRPLDGLSVYAELENGFAAERDAYFDLVEPPTGQSPIADPRGTAWNQLWVRYESPDLWDLRVTGGRQRIKLDDERFVGNVSWRQNEQGYDALLAETSLGVEHLTLQYGRIWDVRRIFGDDGAPALRDFDSDSHLGHLHYDRFSLAKLSLFAYLLDFDNSPPSSSRSYGIRVTGERPLGAPGSGWKARWAASYAHQSAAGSNPVDYTAHYVAAEGTLVRSGVGAVALGYEVLGSDSGKAHFTTPLATGHKFNGFADVFLDNGGARGLRDLYVAIAPELPWKLRGKAVYHRFRTDHDQSVLGDELDFVVSRPIGKHLTILSKGAYFDGHDRGSPTDRWRYWLEVSFDY